MAAFAVLLTPGTASAYLTIKPQVDCTLDNGDGTFTFVVGYRNNTSRAQDLPLGVANYQFPSRLQGTQPTTFRTGTVHGAFTVTLQWWEVPTATWRVDGWDVEYEHALWLAPRCPDGTQLPADGNGTGTAVGLSAAGLVGAYVVLSTRRRMRAPTD